MSIRNKLAEREEQRNKAAAGGNGPSFNDGLPEGVTRYLRVSELKDGKRFAIMADPDGWYFYYCHEDGDFATRATYVRKHTCLHSPKVTGAPFDAFQKPNASVCPSCKAKARRRLYFLIPLYDFELKTWRVFDTKEFHAMKLIGDFDKMTKAAQKFNKAYTLVGDAITLTKTSDGKSYTLESADATDAELAEAQAALSTAIPYEDLANFREIDDILTLLAEADPSKIDKSALESFVSPTQSDAKDDARPIEGGAKDPTLGF